MREVYYLFVQLAPHEWSPPLDMRALACEYFQRYSERPLIVRMCEHAGWYLTFTEIDGEVTCVGSANDAATYPRKVMDFWREVRSAKMVPLGTIKRDSCDA